MNNDGEQRYRPALSDWHLVGLASLVWIAAMVTAPIPIVPAAAVSAAALFARRRLLFVVSLAFLAAGLGHRAVEDFQPRASARFEGEVVVLAEARPVGFGWRATVRLPDGDRVEATGFGRSGIQLRQAAGGSGLTLSGQLSPMTDTSWARSRHLVGRLAVAEISARREPTGLRAGVERVRAAIVAGADSLEPERQPLYLGLVIGEDRLQSPAQRARFRAAGLSHLLAVSGQNVAFVLAVAAPLSRLLGLRGRLVFTVGLLTVFAFATRFEPSVLRATVTAGLATAATLSGYERDGVRLLSLAVTALLLVDPFLVHSVGFQLSVAASAGILLLAPIIANRLPGPMALRQAISVTVAAQVAVLPLQLLYFGPVSAASVPANVLAGWAAGIVMAWGLSVGVVAGLAPAAVGYWLQRPAAWLLIWLDGVAGFAARTAAPMITSGVAVTMAALLVLRWLGAGRALGEGVGRRLVVVVATALIVAVAVASVPEAPSGPLTLDGGGRWYPGDEAAPSVLIVAPDADVGLIDELTRRGLHRVDLVVSMAGGGSGAVVTAAVAELVAPELVLAPAQHRIVGATRVTTPLVIQTTGGPLLLEPSDNELGVISVMASAGAGGSFFDGEP